MDQLNSPAQDLESLKKEVAGTTAEKPKPEFKAAVGMSRLWDARAAGREVAEDTLKKLGGKKPDFFLLFSTIHYEKYGGFQELLNGVWEVLPEGTPLIGGTVQGFVNNYGCYTRGVASIAVNSPELKVSASLANNTKRNPIGAANKISKELWAQQNYKYRNSCIIELVSGVTIPDIPFFGRETIIKESSIGKIASKLFFLSSFFNTGVDKADDIIERLAQNFPASKIIGSCLSDDGKLIRNYQFYGSRLCTNSLVCLKIETDYDFNIKATQALKPTTKKIHISKFSKDRRIIKEINGRNASKEYLNILGTDLEFLGQRDRVFRTTFYYPMSYKKGDFYHPCIVGPIINGELVVGNKIEMDNLELCRLSPVSLIENIGTLSKELKVDKTPFVFGVICQTVSETLGSHIYVIHQMFKENLGEIPFLAILSSGESIYDKNLSHHLYESFNTLSINTSSGKSLVSPS